MHTIIHIPQNFKKVSMRGMNIFVEAILMPAVLVAVFVSIDQTVLGIILVFVWRALCFGIRWMVSKHIPVTSILTFVVLLSRTFIAIALGLMISSETGLKAYLLPACIISFSLGSYFIISASGKKPIIMKLAEDFVDLTDSSKTLLLPVFRVITGVIGIVHVVSSTLGIWIVLKESETSAAHMTSGLSVASPLLCFILSTIAASYTIKRLSIKVNLRAELVHENIDKDKFL